jgi:autotransporter-associated beta strand protein
MYVKNSFGRNASSHSRFSTAKKKSVVALAAAASLALMAGSRSARADTLLWTDGAGGNNWDGAALDWNDLTSSTNGVAYTDGSAVEFTDAGPGGSVVVGNVTAGNGVSPLSVTFIDQGGATGNYTFTDLAGDTNGIQGAATLTLATNYNGTITLNNLNTYTGATTVNSGTLDLALVGAISSSSALKMGGGTLLVNSGGTQTVASAAFTTPGQSTINVNSSSTLALGAATFASTPATAGGAVEFIGPATIGASNAAVAATGQINTSSGTASSILGQGYATVGQYDWAAKDSTGTFVTGLSQVSGYTAVTPTSSISLSGNADFSGAAGSYRQSGGSQTATTIRFNNPATKDTFGGNGGNVGFETKTGSTVTTSGILITPNIGAENVEIADESSGAAASFIRVNGTQGAVLWQNNTSGFFITTAGIEFSSTGTTPSLTYAGPGTVQEDTTFANSYAGATYLEGGVVEDLTSGLFPTATIANNGINLNGGTIMAASSSQTYANAVSANSTGGVAALTGDSITMSGVISGSGSVTTGYGQVAGTGSGTANATAQFGAGVVVLSNTGNSYTGGTNIIGGTLLLTATSGTALGSGTVNVKGGRLAGTGTVTNAVNDNSGSILPGSLTAIGTLTLGSLNLNGGAVTFYNSGGNGGSTDLLVLTGAAGLSVSSASTINFYSASNQSGTSTVTANAAGTYDLFSVANGGLAASDAATLESDYTASTISIGGAVVVDSYTFGSSGNYITMTIGSANVNTTWQNNSGAGNWSTSGNWTSGVPHIMADTANFTTDGGVITNPITVTLDTNETVGTVNFNAPTSYSIVQGGSSVLTLDNTGNSIVTIADANGNHSIGAPISLNGPLAVSVTNSTNTLGISGIISNDGAATESLTKSGAGTLLLTGANTYGSGSSAINTIINGGTLQLGNGTTNGSVIGNISVAAGATLALDLDPTSFTNVVSGSGTLETLSNQNLTTANPSFSGTLVAGIGTLTLASQSVLNTGGIGAGNAALSGTGTFDLSGLNLTANGISGYANGTIDEISSTANVTLTDTQTGSTTFAGTIQNSGTGVVSLSLTGNAGVLNLTGPNTYTGSTSISGGGTTISAATIAVGTGGSITGSGSYTLNGGALVVNGGTVTTTAVVAMQTASAQPAGYITINSGNASFGGIAIGPASSNSTVTINGGTVSLGAYSSDRDNSTNSGLPTGLADGLIVNGGTVTATSIALNTTNSWAEMGVTGGSVTITGSTGGLLVGDGNNATRGGFLEVTGGSLTYLGTDGMILDNTAVVGYATLTGGTTTLSGITLNSPAAQTSNTAGSGATLVVGGTANLYVGSLGIVANPASNIGSLINFNGGATIGAIANWSSSANITLGGTATSSITLQAADSSNTPHNISLSGVLSGNGPLIISGSGAVTLSGSNSYSAGGAANGTTVNGTLFVNTTDLVNGGTGPYPLAVNSGGTLGGNGVINGTVTVAGGGLIDPGEGGTNTSQTLSLDGTVQLDDGADLDFTLDTFPGTAADAVIDASTSSGDSDFVEALDLPGGGTVNVNFTFPNGAPETGVPYTLIDYSGGTDVYVGGGGVEWTTDGEGVFEDFATITDTGSEIDVTFIPIPEPASLGILSLGVLGLLRRRRSRA